MSYTFTAEQLIEIKRLFEIAESYSETHNTDAINHRYADVYAYIRDQIPTELVITK